MIRKSVLVLSLIALGPNYSYAKESTFSLLYGSPPKQHEISFGCLAWHFTSSSPKYFYPFLSYTNPNSFFVAVFKNSFNRDSVSIAIERYWYNTRVLKEHTLTLGYQLGLIYGYCLGPLLNLELGSCRANNTLIDQIPVIPAFSLFAKYKVSQHTGLRLTYSGVILKADLSIYY